MKITLILSLLLLASPFVHADKKAEAIAHGKSKFQTCAACHGQDGKGLKLGPTNLMAPGYEGSTVVNADPELFALVLLKGIKKEDQKYMGVMVGLGDGLNDKDLAGIMTYIRNDFSEKKDLITEKQISEWRAKYKDRKDQVTKKEISEFIKAAAETEKN